jgi:hypothetical protein
VEWSPLPEISVSLEKDLDLPYDEYYIELYQAHKRICGESTYDANEGKVKFQLKAPTKCKEHEVQLKHKNEVLHIWTFK